MEIPKTMGDRFREARLEASKGNSRLATLEGAAEELDVSDASTVGRWERDKVVPSNENALEMARVYRAPDLLQSYCANLCPIGRGRVQDVSVKSVAMLALRLANTSRDLEDDIAGVMQFAEDGVIDAVEMPQFVAAMARLSKVANAINALKVAAEKWQIGKE